MIDVFMMKNLMIERVHPNKNEKVSQIKGKIRGGRWVGWSSFIVMPSGIIPRAAAPLAL